MNIIKSTVENGMCIGCGTCVAACAKDALKISYSKKKEFVPVINNEKCVQCGICVNVCPHSIVNNDKEQKMYNEAQRPEMIGLQESECYHFVVNDKDKLMESTSGGALTELICEMFKQKKIDSVIHARRIPSKKGEIHYEIIESENEDQACNNRGTIYGPLTYDNVLLNLKNKEKKVLFVGTPCVIKAIKNLTKNVKAYSKLHYYTCALVCSHNVNGQFTDFLYDFYGLNDGQFVCDLRAKDEMMNNCSQFFSKFSKNGKKIVMENRFTSPFTKLWRNYFFAMNSCISCRDFWGREADCSFKDAWGSIGEKNTYGSSIVIIRNPEICSVFRSIKTGTIKSLSEHEVLVSQKSTVDYKQVKKSENVMKCQYENINNMQISKEAYLNNSIEEIKNELKKIVVEEENDINKREILDSCKDSYFKKRCNIIKKRWKMYPMKKESNCNKIVLFGGFGGHNEGDEAQIDETYHWLKKNFPDYMIKILSHVQQHTFSHHGYCAVGDNSRLAIWDIDQKNEGLYHVENIGEKIKFWARAIRLIFNAWLTRYNLPTIGLSARQSSFLYEIKTSKLVYISGGGFLTGDTLSRLWDHLVVMEIANIFNVPYVLSGQTIGLWNSNFTKKISKREFDRAKAITLRDPESSIAELKEIGVEGENIFVMFDDALYCRKKENMDETLLRMGIEKEKYIVVNMHFWGAKKNKEKKKILKKMKYVLQLLLDKTDMKIVLLPMTSSDVSELRLLFETINSNRVYMSAMDASFDFTVIRGLIANSYCCITMKHHPIVFAMGECIPTIAINYKPYYEKKNVGALGMFGMEKYSLSMDDGLFEDKFERLFEDINGKYDGIRKHISSQLNEMKLRREKLLKIIKYSLKY